MTERVDPALRGGEPDFKGDVPVPYAILSRAWLALVAGTDYLDTLAEAEARQRMSEEELASPLWRFMHEAGEALAPVLGNWEDEQQRLARNIGDAPTDAAGTPTGTAE